MQEGEFSIYRSSNKIYSLVAMTFKTELAARQLKLNEEEEAQKDEGNHQVRQMKITTHRKRARMLIMKSIRRKDQMNDQHKEV
jgi:hypothetical protein